MNEQIMYYCPMHCEGDKQYREPGNCPVCGMDLVPTAQLEGNPEADRWRRRLVISTAFALPVFLISMSDMIPGNPIYNWMDRSLWNWLQLLLSLPVIFYAGWTFFVRAWNSIRRRSLNMFTLIGMGTTAAFLFSIAGLIFPSFFPEELKFPDGSVHLYFEASVVIITLVILGQWIEARAHGRTNDALESLLKLRPAKVKLLTSRGDIEIETKAVMRGDRLRVLSGERIPVDGVIEEGNTNIDESAITGEPIPVDKKPGAWLHSGSMNGMAAIVMKAEKVGAQSMISQIIEQVKEASRSRSDFQRLADLVSSWFVPIVIGVAVITFLVWALALGSLNFALVNAIAVLLIACPCALGLATPMSVKVGMGKAAQQGVFVKEAKFLENLQRVDTLLLDKTGTLTEGKPRVARLEFVKDGIDRAMAQRILLSLCSQSKHPLSTAVIKHLPQTETVELQLQEIPGAGLKAKVDGVEWGFGNEALVGEEKVGARTSSFLYQSGEKVCTIEYEDSLKEGVKDIIHKLQRKGLEIGILSGDRQEVVEAVGKKLNIGICKGNLRPGDKLEAIKSFQSEGRTIAFGGDGINDAPALSQAEVGIAMGDGTDVANDTADISLLGGNLSGILKAREISEALVKNIKQNLFLAFVYNTIGIPIAAGILFPLFGILLSPMIAAAAMSFSSVSVIANSLRLRNLRL